MSKTKQAKKQRQNQLKLLKRLKLESGELTGTYVYQPNAEMSETKDGIATRPQVVVGQDPELGYLVVPLSKGQLRELPLTPLSLPYSDLKSYQAPNRAYWAKQVPAGQLRWLPETTWQVVKTNLKAVSKACKQDQAINLSLENWLEKATLVGLA